MAASCHICKCDLEGADGILISIVKGTIYGTKVGGPDLRNNFKNYVICRKLECTFTLHDQLGKNTQEEITKNQTNAVGPLSRGAPGAAFNEHFETPASNGEQKYPVDPNNPNKILGHCTNVDCPTCGDFGLPRV